MSEDDKDVKSKKNRRIQNKNLTPGGPGRPKGQRNYKTIYREALQKIAKKLGKDADEFETEIVMTAITKARKGDLGFYKDLLDRLHGKPQQSVKHTGSKDDPIHINTNKKFYQQLNVLVKNKLREQIEESYDTRDDTEDSE